MKKIDVSDSVMKKIERFEQSRSSLWLREFYIGITILFLLVAGLLWISWQSITDLQGWDLLSIFAQDKEIIRDYWQDSVMTFIQELPIETLFYAVIIMIILIAVIGITRKRRKVFENRIRELAKRDKVRKNNT